MKKEKPHNMQREFGEKPQTLYDIDYLLGVFDKTRMGALRFKTSLDGSFS